MSNTAMKYALLLQETQKKKETALRNSDVRGQQALRRAKTNHSLSGINGGDMESRLLQTQTAANQEKASVSAEMDPLISKYMAYLDWYKRQSAASGRSGGNRDPRASTSANQQALANGRAAVDMRLPGSGWTSAYSGYSGVDHSNSDSYAAGASPESYAAALMRRGYSDTYIASALERKYG